MYKEDEKTPWEADVPLAEPEEEIPLYEAWDAEREWVYLEDACDRVAGEFVNLYPPGTPMAVPGEKLSSERIRMLDKCLNSGLTVQGVDEERRICVLR